MLGSLPAWPPFRVRRASAESRDGINAARPCTCSGDGMTRAPRSMPGRRMSAHGDRAMRRSRTAEAKVALLAYQLERPYRPGYRTSDPVPGRLRDALARRQLSRGVGERSEACATGCQRRIGTVSATTVSLHRTLRRDWTFPCEPTLMDKPRRTSDQAAILGAVIATFFTLDANQGPWDLTDLLVGAAAGLILLGFAHLPARPWNDLRSRSQVGAIAAVGSFCLFLISSPVAQLIAQDDGTKVSKYWLPPAVILGFATLVRIFIGQDGKVDSAITASSVGGGDGEVPAIARVTGAVDDAGLAVSTQRDDGSRKPHDTASPPSPSTPTPTRSLERLYCSPLDSDPAWGQGVAGSATGRPSGAVRIGKSAQVA